MKQLFPISPQKFGDDLISMTKQLLRFAGDNRSHFGHAVGLTTLYSIRLDQGTLISISPQFD
jgi:hypothetical protein